MNRSLRAAVGLLLWVAVCFPALIASQTRIVPSIRRVQVLGSGNQVEIEIEASDRIIPQINVLTGPDRLVVDFVNAVPGAQLRGLSVNRGDVKSLRVGLFSSDPPVTRVVLDLKGPQRYQVFPSGRTVIVKFGGGPGAQTAGFSPASGPVLVNTNYPVSAEPVSSTPPPPAKPRLVVSFRGGLLSISSDKATLSEVLFAVHERTGAEIAIPAGAEQEQVVADLGPAPAPEILAHLLNGSRFNFLILSSATDPGALDRVILTSRPDGPMPASRPQLQTAADDEDEAEAQPRVAPQGGPTPAANPNPAAGAQPAAPDTKTPPTNDVPD
jgi:AMIN domain-containing protein